MATLDFITSNPATDAYRAGQKADQANELNEQKVLSSIREEDEKKQTWPTRLRKLDADTSLAETHAQTAQDEAPYAEPMKVAQLRQVNAGATNTEMQGFYKALEVLPHNPKAAKEISDSIGHPLPQAIIDDAATRQDVIDAAATYKDLAGKNPKLWVQSMRGFIDDRRKQREDGIAPQPGDAWTTPSLPQMPETTGDTHNFEISNRAETDENGKPVVRSYKFDKRTGAMVPIEGEGAFQKPTGAGAGGAGRETAYSLRLKIGSALYGEGTEKAANYAAGTHQITPQEATKFALSQAETELRNDPSISSRFKTPNDRANWKSARADEISKYVLSGSAPPPTTTPQPPEQPGFFDRLLGRGGASTSAVVRPGETISNVEVQPTPAPQRPDLMSKGDGGKPLNTPLPPEPPRLPAGPKQYNPGLQQWRVNGQIFDQNGNLVAQ